MSKASVFNNKEPIAFYSPSYCYQDAINRLVEVEVCSNKEEAEKHRVLNSLYEVNCEDHWSWMEETVKNLCDKYFKNGAGLVCPAFGWTKSAGASDFENDAFKAFQQVYLNTDFWFEVYLKRNHFFGVHLEVVVHHHDSDTGDHMFIVSKKYYEQFIQEHFGRKAA